MSVSSIAAAFRIDAAPLSGRECCFAEGLQ